MNGWFPIRVYWQDGCAMVDWCRLGELRFEDPFFDQTVDRALRHPFNDALRLQTPLDVLGPEQDERPGMQPTGLIFHMSRCGSTLLGRMLGALPGSLVISEAPPVDQVLRARTHAPQVTEDQRALWLRWIVGALGQRWHGEEQRYFLKLDAWHALDLPLIERAFPGVPWVFLYRDPVEVLVSHQRQMSWMMSAVNGPHLLGVSVADAFPIPREEYAARVLARICEAVVQRATDPGRLINYRELSTAALDRIPRLFGLDLSEIERDAMRAAARYDAKHPTRPFTSDAALKQREADPTVRDAAQRWLAPIYGRLEELAGSALPPRISS
jgi:hypothetical protein